MSSELVDPMASVRAYLAAEKSDNTRRAYASDFADFSAWCDTRRYNGLPAEPIVVAQYLAALADGGLKASTITRRCAAIRYAHKAAGLEPPTNAEGVKAVLRGIRRTKGTRPLRKAPAVAAAIHRMLEALPDTLAGKRDRAILLLGFAAALRRSELAAVRVEDIERTPKGFLLTLPKSKTDQEGKGQTVVIPRGARLKPVEAIDAWALAANVTTGPLFREVDRHGRVGTRAISDRSIARIVKRAALAAGLDASLFSGHSLRAGFVTQALDDGVDTLKIMQQTRHEKVDTLKTYDRRERGFDDHAGKDFL
jgi:site-specific recombinase XerD